MTVLVNRACGTNYNRKRIRRVMRLHGLQLSPNRKRRNGRPHLGTVETAESDRRWCSDAFEIPCWNGEAVHVAFVLDCHDREVIAWVGRDRDLRGGDVREMISRAVQARFPEDGKGPEPLRF